jgi:hypothetical protein
MRRPSSGRSRAKRSRTWRSTGICRSAQSVRRRPCSASPESAMSEGSTVTRVVVISLSVRESLRHSPLVLTDLGALRLLKYGLRSIAGHPVLPPLASRQRGVILPSLRDLKRLARLRRQPEASSGDRA